MGSVSVSIRGDGLGSVLGFRLVLVLVVMGERTSGGLALVLGFGPGFGSGLTCVAPGVRGDGLEVRFIG